MKRLTSAAARTLMVAAQGLDRRPRPRATKASVLAAIRRMGALQIDTIHVVNRSPYFVLWSRLGAYEPRWLDELLADGHLFEYWAHEASFLPIEDYPLYRHRMADPGSLGWKYSHAWIAQHRAVVDRVLSTVRARGPVRSSDFERTDGRGGGWWSWKPEKRALELLFTAGELMIAHRERFQRVYDLRERVLREPGDGQARDEAQRTLALKAVAALGITTATWVADYFRTPRTDTRAILPALAHGGALIRVEVEGWREPAYIHPSRRALAQRAAAGTLRPTLTTLLSPFDPLVWDRSRTRTVFDFDYRLECYVPAPKRRWGYFTLPILRRGRLIGRLDAKAHRATCVFEVKALWLEPGVRAGDALIADVAAALRDVATWHDTPRVVVRRSDPRGLARDLQRAARLRVQSRRPTMWPSKIARSAKRTATASPMRITSGALRRSAK
jgi:uncharacterized protein